MPIEFDCLNIKKECNGDVVVKYQMRNEKTGK